MVKPSKHRLSQAGSKLNVNMSTHREKLADVKLLDKIDKLFELNVGEKIALPPVLIFSERKQIQKLTNAVVDRR